MEQLIFETTVFPVAIYVTPLDVSGLAFYDVPACNLVGLAFDAGPFGCLVIVGASKRHFLAADGDNNVTFGDIAVPSYPHFGNVSAYH